MQSRSFFLMQSRNFFLMQRRSFFQQEPSTEGGCCALQRVELKSCQLQVLST
jgi:hypothetical protein